MIRYSWINDKPGRRFQSCLKYNVSLNIFLYFFLEFESKYIFFGLRVVSRRFNEIFSVCSYGKEVDVSGSLISIFIVTECDYFILCRNEDVFFLLERILLCVVELELKYLDC